IWRDSSVRNKWLEVTAKANGRTGLPRPDRFYFASLPGETGNDPDGLRVDLLDLLQLTRANRLARGAAITSLYDFNRDGRVGALDFAVARSNLFRSLAITAPAPASAVSIPVAPSTLGLAPDRPTGPGGILGV